MKPFYQLTIIMIFSILVVFVASVSNDGILLHAQSPANEPVIPSIIFTMFKVGN